MNVAQIATDVSELASDRMLEQPRFGSIDAAMAHSLLSPSRLGSLLRNPLLRHPQVRVALEGRALPVAAFTTTRRIGTASVADAIDPSEVARWLTRGATITIDSLEYLSQEVDEICGAIAEEVNLPATATAYVTPPGRRGLNPHTDEEDVFVLQTFGAKKWIVDSAQRQEVATASGFPLNEEMLQVEPIVLCPGDMFFLPAGTPHVAEALDHLSIHITFSVERPRVRDALARAIDSLAKTRPALNRLQAWDATPATVSDLAEAVASMASDDPSSLAISVPSPLPYDSWGNLGHDRLYIELLTDCSIHRTDSGYVAQFPEFRLTVGKDTGGLLAALARDGMMDVRPNDGELREVLFHLAGRGAVAITQGRVL